MVSRDFRNIWSLCKIRKELLTNEAMPIISKALLHRSSRLEVSPDLLSVIENFKVSINKDKDTSHELLYGIHPISCAIDAKRRSIYSVFYRKDLLDRNSRIKTIVEQCQEHDIQVKAVPRHKFDNLLQQRSDAPHQGVLAKASKLNYTPIIGTEQYIGKLVEESDTSEQVWLLLNEIQDPMNFGSILRSSYFLGVHKVFVSMKNSCSLTPVVSKASSGAMEIMKIHSVPSVTNFCKILRALKWDIVATELPTQSSSDHTSSIPLSSYKRNEGTGLPNELVEICSHKLFVESRQKSLVKNGVDSMNVSAAAAVILHRLLNSRS